jgi:hypothetical protein
LRLSCGVRFGQVRLDLCPLDMANNHVLSGRTSASILLSILPKSAFATFEACRDSMMMSVVRGGPEVAGRGSNRGLWSTLADAGLHQCIRSLVGACCAPDHHGYQRACDLISGQASMGHLGHQGSHAPGRPILHRRLILSQSSAGKSTDYVIDSLLVLRRSFVRAWRPFLRPDLRLQRCAARRDRQGWPSRLPCLLRQRCQATP